MTTRSVGAILEVSEMTNKRKGNQMKFYIRRAVAGALATPIIAGAYFAFYALLVGAGADPTNTPSGVWGNGLMFGTMIAVAFTFAPQILRLERKLYGEEN